MERARDEIAARLHYESNALFDASITIHTQLLQCDLLTSLESFVRTIFLFCGKVVGLTAALHTLRFQGKVPFPLYATIDNKSRLNSFLTFCRNGGVFVNTRVADVLYELRQNETVAYIACAPQVFLNPQNFNALPYVRPLVLTVEQLCIGRNTIELGDHAYESAIPLSVTEVMLQAFGRNIVPVACPVITQHNLLAVFILKSLLLKNTLQWKVLPIRSPTKQAELLIFEAVDEPLCPISQERTRDCIKLWCGHVFSAYHYAGFLQSNGDSVTRCPLCRACVFE